MTAEYPWWVGVEGLVAASGKVVSVNVGAPRTVTWAGRAVTSANGGRRVVTRVAARGVNLVGDNQADRRVHGGPDKAVYCYAAEDYAWWCDELGTPVGPGTFGENITTVGIDLRSCVIGEQRSRRSPPTSKPNSNRASFVGRYVPT